MSKQELLAAAERLVRETLVAGGRVSPDEKKVKELAAKIARGVPKVREPRQAA